MDLFNEAELEQIRSEFTFNSVARYNRNHQDNLKQLNTDRTRNSELDSEAFTEHRIDTEEDEKLRNVSTKSIILAPFNTTQSHFSSVHGSVKELIVEKEVAIKLSKYVRDQDAQYEKNNNGELDNGVYNKFVNNSVQNDEDGEKGDEELVEQPTLYHSDDSSKDYKKDLAKALGD